MLNNPTILSDNSATAVANLAVCDSSSDDATMMADSSRSHHCSSSSSSSFTTRSKASIAAEAEATSSTTAAAVALSPTTSTTSLWKTKEDLLHRIAFLNTKGIYALVIKSGHPATTAAGGTKRGHPTHHHYSFSKAIHSFKTALALLQTASTIPTIILAIR